MHKKIINKHKISGKHSLADDIIFKGKKDNVKEEEDHQMSVTENFMPIEQGSSYWEESINNEEYIRRKKIKEDIYDILKEHSKINFESKRRNPSREDFNKYYKLSVEKLKSNGYKRVELFVELAYYFSDNLLNILQLLDSKWRNPILQELEEYVGKVDHDKLHKLEKKNIKVDSEINFVIDEKVLSGKVVEILEDDKDYLVDTMENKYEIKFESIVKISNNNKIKHDLNKLKYLDFL